MANWFALTPSVGRVLPCRVWCVVCGVRKQVGGALVFTTAVRQIQDDPLKEVRELSAASAFRPAE